MGSLKIRCGLPPALPLASASSLGPLYCSFASCHVSCCSWLHLSPGPSTCHGCGCPWAFLPAPALPAAFSPEEWCPWVRAWPAPGPPVLSGHPLFRSSHCCLAARLQRPSHSWNALLFPVPTEVPLCLGKGFPVALLAAVSQAAQAALRCL